VKEVWILYRKSFPVSASLNMALNFARVFFAFWEIPYFKNRKNSSKKERKWKYPVVFNKNGKPGSVPETVFF
jgi:hypothetical protein